MAVVKPFKALRPAKELAKQIACLPYDVMNREEAKQMAEGNPYSFLHVVRSEIDLADEVDAYSEDVYLKARENLDRFEREKILLQDESPKFYIYRQIMFGRVQTGIVAINSIDDYINGKIKKHEFTRPIKEEDRIKNFDYCDANTAPIFLTYRRSEKICKILNAWIKFHKPVYNFTSEDEITHIVWEIDDQEVNEAIQEAFAEIDYLYIADGHHRSASAVKVGLMRREEIGNYSGEEEFNFFMSVIFPDEDLFIMDYNRVVKDLNGYDKEDFLKAVEESFIVEKQAPGEPFHPRKPRSFGMYLDGAWYELSCKEGIYDPEDPVDKLDVSILQKNLLDRVLGIKDPRTDERIDFVGGIRGLKELERRVNGGWKLAFSMYPTGMDELLDIADSGNVMPPKSTWFEPKLRSGLFVHLLR